jgi:hypothetical protein
MSAPDIVKYWDFGLKFATTAALIGVVLLGTQFVTREEFVNANARIAKIEEVLIRMEKNAETDKRHDHTLADHEARIRHLEKKP